MKKVTADEFLELLKSDKALHDRYMAALRGAGDKTAAEAAETLGYQIENPELQTLADDQLSFVAGGRQRSCDSIDLEKLFPRGETGDLDYGFLGDQLRAK